MFFLWTEKIAKDMKEHEKCHSYSSDRVEKFLTTPWILKERRRFTSSSGKLLSLPAILQALITSAVETRELFFIWAQWSATIWIFSF